MKLSASRRLFLGFAVAIVLAILIGMANYLTFRDQAAESDRVAHSYKVMNEINEAHNNIVEMQTGRRGYSATGDKKFLEPYYKGYNAIGQDMKELASLVADNPVQSQNVRDAVMHIERILQFWSNLSVDVEKHTREDILRVTTEEKVLMDNIRLQFSRLLFTESQLLKERQGSNRSALARANWISIGGTILVQVIIIILIYFVLNEFRNRKKAEETVRKNLLQVSELNEAANNRNWLLSGVAEVNDSIQQAGDVSSLTSGVLNTVVQYMDVVAGALYLYDEEEQKLVMSASVSLPADVRRTYLLGEGLVGTAATDTEIIVTPNVPTDYWKLESATGSVHPGEVVCMPLRHSGVLKGVLELARFNSFASLHVDLLEAIANSVAIAINAAESHDKIMKLLAQVQEQKIHLQNQQEELYQTNEELTRQAEVLQASEEELRVQEEELRQTNAELEEKNEAVEVSRQALANKARELELSSKYKSEFLANMSHELRTPLNSVLILAKLLSENKAGNLTDKQTEYARIIHKSGSDLLNLINDILDLAKIEAGKADLQFGQENIASIVEDLQQMFSVVSEEKGIHFTVEKSPRVPETVYTDKVKLEQIIKNLLSNAFKFTPGGGTVGLAFNVAAGSERFIAEHLRKARRMLEIAVSDTGIGIPGDKQQLIFEAFQQADGSTNRKYGGTGLGLSISKELVRVLGGEIKLESTEGKGSTFFIYLPLDKTAAESLQQAAPLATAENKTIAELTKNVVLQTQLPDDRDRLRRGDKVMLIIEDDTEFAKLVQDFAHGKGFKTIVAVRGDEGLHYAEKYKPSAIVLDLKLPGLDGWSLLKILKADDRLKQIPVHVISAMDNLDRLGKSAISWLKKPVEQEDLEHAFRSISRHIPSDIKKVLIISGNYLKNDAIGKMIEERYGNMQCDYVPLGPDALQRIKAEKYDCVVADIGKELETGIEEVKRIHTLTSKRNIPVIIYLDKELRAGDEMQLKKISNVIIQDSLDAKDRLIDELELFLFKVEEVNASPRPATGARTMERVLRGKKVLLADDDIRNVFALSNLLEEQDMTVITAGDGIAALEQLNSNPDVDIVLMDIMMPEMDGYEAIRHIRKDPRFRNLPVIALTAKAMLGDREKTIDAGASDYITKPVDGGKLFSLMRVWLSA